MTMGNSTQIARFSCQAEQGIDDLTAVLHGLATSFNLKPLENDFQDRAFEILMDAYRERIEPMLERMQCERDFIASGEAASENKAEDDRSWYRDIMKNSELKDE